MTQKGPPVEKQRKRKSAADRRAEIVDTVIELSAALGPDRVTTQHLADAVGVTQPAIFRHFATKTEIWEAVGARIVNQIETVAIDVADCDEPVSTYIRELTALVRSYPALPSIVTSRELQAESEGLRKAIVAALDACGTQIARLISKGQNNGTYRNDLEAAAIARLVTSSCMGLCTAWVVADHDFDLMERGSELASTLETTLAPC
ncbi:TetR/AcrR family transcriptional regulator [Maritimibacter sp. DP1N21-5]|uniref:TetR/AcrR family transcriptional regulator n=1 Tax=Maritimibacter sp. DP1N21-5 TaxID=2836867 RepID=UPI001C48E5D0|nr:TetR/AcrR family transcriptional regulator [Maritimibacter sp. DP1N21-5]MBV7408669.1 TetR/AcrR family transcriptional regulator [Maritimibacter sp. DP1N21-5]